MTHTTPKNPFASECLFALAMASHERLGSASPARHLSREIFERIADYLAPRLQDMELFFTEQQVHALSEGDGGENRCIVSRSRAFKLRASLFLLPHLKSSRCANSRCQEQGVQCTCRRVQRAFDDIKFSVRLERLDGGSILQLPDANGAPALSCVSHVPWNSTHNYKRVQTCGRFCDKRARSWSAYECSWRLKVRNDIEVSHPNSEHRKIDYTVNVFPTDETIRVKYPKLSRSCHPFQLDT
jgi:hypothetical protein